MYFLICFILILFLSYHKADFIRKHNTKLYTIAAVITTSDVLFQIYLLMHKTRLQGTIRDIESLLSRGILGTACIALVMYIGALNNKKSTTRKWLSIRAELSIIACLLMLPHNLIYAYYSLTNWMRLAGQPASNFKTISLLISLSGILSVSLMLPLFITSFRVVRNKMKAKSWKKLQSFSYFFYFLLYFQVMLVHLGFENRKNYIEALCYSLIFISYAFLRIRKKISAR